MPVQNCQLNNKPGFKWGDEGKCYTYTPGNKTSMDNAKKKVMEQAVAIEQFTDSYSDYPKQATENAKIALRWAQRKLEQIDKKVELAAKKISFDYDDTLSLSKYQEKAKQLIADGNLVYIISAHHNASNMFSVADKVGIPHSRIYATGSNKNKIEKIKELNIDIHYDNNQDVIDELKRNHIGTHKAELDSQVQRMSDIMKFIKNK
jgi:soluble P-type ATPase